jgi:alanyl-tRNA synthetase
MQKLSRNFEETKASLNGTIENLKAKAKEAHDISEKLIQSMAEVEQKNQQLQSDNSTLLTAQKASSVEIAALRQQVAKDKQTMQNQISGIAMLNDTRMQRAVKDAKEEASRRCDEMMAFVHDAIGGFYGSDEANRSEESFRQLIALAKDDLEKLKYFQVETTKYSLQ